MNWELIHELLLAELKRLDAGTSQYTSKPEWWKAELTRMNDIAVEKALQQEGGPNA